VTLWRQLKRVAARATGQEKLPGFGTGLIRASFAKSHQAEGQGADEVRELLGHKEATSTVELLSRTTLRKPRGKSPAQEERPA
jgi:hypothetical protein